MLTNLKISNKTTSFISWLIILIDVLKLLGIFDNSQDTIVIVLTYFRIVLALTSIYSKTVIFQWTLILLSFILFWIDQFGSWIFTNMLTDFNSNIPPENPKNSSAENYTLSVESADESKEFGFTYEQFSNSFLINIIPVMIILISRIKNEVKIETKEGLILLMGLKIVFDVACYVLCYFYHPYFGFVKFSWPVSKAVFCLVVFTFEICSFSAAIYAAFRFEHFMLQVLLKLFRLFNLLQITGLLLTVDLDPVYKSYLVVSIIIHTVMLVVFTRYIDWTLKTTREHHEMKRPLQEISHRQRSKSMDIL